MELSKLLSSCKCKSAKSTQLLKHFPPSSRDTIQRAKQRPVGLLFGLDDDDASPWSCRLPVGNLGTHKRRRDVRIPLPGILIAGAET